MVDFIRPDIRIVGLCGPSGVGKSTVAEMYKEAVLSHDNLVTQWHSDSFARPLKEMLEALYKTGDVRPSNYSWERLCDKDERFLMQSLGTGWGRDMVGEDFWVNIAERKLRTLPQNSWVVYDDVRMPNEATFIKRVSPRSLVVKLDPGERNLHMRGTDPGNKETTQHITERQELKVDMTVNNGLGLAEQAGYSIYAAMEGKIRARER